jgi:Ca2+-binding RTX toxin-like protein
MPFYFGDDADNTYLGTGGTDYVYGNGGKDHLNGAGANDTIYGGADNDYLDGGQGADFVYGGTGDDTYYLQYDLDTITEYTNEGIDTVYAWFDHQLAAHVENLQLVATAIHGFGNDIDNVVWGNGDNNLLWGLGGADDLFGGAGQDTLYGGIGDDYLSGEGGADTMWGGADNDIYQVWDAGDVVSENANEGLDTVYSRVSHTLSANVERLFLLIEGGAINGTGNGLDNFLYGNASDNVLSGGGGSDSLHGFGGMDTMFGGAGNDFLYGDGAFDQAVTMHGGSDNDGYFVDGDDTVVEGVQGGIDTVYSSVTYALGANVENLYLMAKGGNINGTGNTLTNSIYGNAGDNTLDGGAAPDQLWGYGGNASYIVDNFFDKVVEFVGAGDDVVYAKVSYTLSANVEDLSLNVGNGTYGTGNSMDNTIYGNAGDNVLDGAGGADELSGIGGNDTFVFKAGQANGDIVYAFEGNGAAAGDVLQFEGFGTQAAGATFVQQAVDSWLITSADGLIQETITVYGAVTANDYVFV